MPRWLLLVLLSGSVLAASHTSEARGKPRELPRALTSETWRAIARLLPTPGFHLHLRRDGGLVINGAPADRRALTGAIAASFDLVDSTHISVLVTRDGGVRIPAETRKLLEQPGVVLYTVQPLPRGAW